MTKNKPDCLSMMTNLCEKPTPDKTLTTLLAARGYTADEISKAWLYHHLYMKRDKAGNLVSLF